MRNLIYKSLNFISPVFNAFLKNRLRVLAYHDIIDPLNFENQIRWLKANYNLIDIEELKDYLSNRKSLPSKSLLITLDDGDRSVFQYALPIFRKYQVPACLFVISDLIDTRKDFWWDTIKKNEVKNGLSNSEIMKIINTNKRSSNRDRVEFLKKYSLTQHHQLTTAEIEELIESRVHIGNHSHTHPMFDKLEQNELHDELTNVRTFFDLNKIGDYSVFAYPNGNYTEITEKLLIENNIEIAFLFDHKINNRRINPLRISRIAVDSDNSMAEFKSKVSGLHPTIIKMRKG
ncbi:polysaccharide deacetylase family protein [Christiangramia sp. LLG6405-1]|uniref:polysaccharide deacetylase family protein n=1 Tax=Christiangramia sp. LLG6405-1 TaxID=3160832 RepID=UPI00386D2B4F